MARRINPSQLRSKLRQVESKMRRAQSRVQQAARKAEQDARRAEQKLKRDAQQRQQRANRAITQYNNAVRAHNRQVKADRTRMQQTLQQLKNVKVSTRYKVLYRSTRTLNDAYLRLRESPAFADRVEVYENLRDRAEQENANSLNVASVLLGQPTDDSGEDENLTDTTITSELTRISADLDGRWRGALYALSPQNPDAARQFCTSAREIITGILDIGAPEEAVLVDNPDCEKTPERGTPTRRARIHYCLQRKGIEEEDLETFIEEDIKNVVELFSVLSKATHGPTGIFGVGELSPIKKRVENAITFLVNVAV